MFIWGTMNEREKFEGGDQRAYRLKRAKQGICAPSALPAIASGVATLIAVTFGFFLLPGCSTEKPRAISMDDLSGNWNYTPPREYWPDQKFTLKIEQHGERLAAKLVPLFKASGNAFEKQSLEGSLIGTQVYFDLRSDNRSIGTLLGTISQDARSIVGSIQYNNHPRLVWSASR